jgi:hypothetical protein
MREQRNAVRSGDALHTRLGGNERFHRIELTQHRRGEDRRPRALRDEIFGDLAVADVRCGTEAVLPIAEAPVICRSRERGTRILAALRSTVGIVR